ncbi:hypothetical protein BY996DRAFT_6471618 [Phakopsora pachyrhizi]|nr:hypothetical protein BY996DRAFT_6471618 [Phakopsora pachyrhizi]
MFTSLQKNPITLLKQTVISLNTNQDMFSGSALSNNDKYTSFAQVLQSVSSDELDYLVPENGPAVLWRLVCQSKLNNPMSLTPDERDYCTLKHNRWQLINKADDLPLNVGRDSLQRFLDHLGPKFQYLGVDDLQGYWQMESWKIHQSKTNHDQ